MHACLLTTLPKRNCSCMLLWHDPDQTFAPQPSSADVFAKPCSPPPYVGERFLKAPARDPVDEDECIAHEARRCAGS